MEHRVLLKARTDSRRVHAASTDSARWKAKDLEQGGFPVLGPHASAFVELQEALPEAGKVACVGEPRKTRTPADCRHHRSGSYRECGNDVPVRRLPHGIETSRRP